MRSGVKVIVKGKGSKLRVMMGLALGKGRIGCCPGSQPSMGGTKSTKDVT